MSVFDPGIRAPSVIVSIRPAAQGLVTFPRLAGSCLGPMSGARLLSRVGTKAVTSQERTPPYSGRCLVSGSFIFEVYAEILGIFGRKGRGRLGLAIQVVARAEVVAKVVGIWT